MTLIAVAVIELGLIPVNADATHSSVEGRIMPFVLHTSIARHASTEKNALSLDEENLKAGVDTYKTMCASCHGTPLKGLRVYTGSRLSTRTTIDRRIFGVHGFTTLLDHQARNTKHGDAGMGKSAVGRRHLAGRKYIEELARSTVLCETPLKRHRHVNDPPVLKAMGAVPG